MGCAASRTIWEEAATISNPTPNYYGTIILLELLLEVKFNENIKLLRAVDGFWKSEAKVRIGRLYFTQVIQNRLPMASLTL
jgi:hypothetical protein